MTPAPASPSAPAPTTSASRLREALDRQRNAFLAEDVWPAAARRERLRRLHGMLLTHQDHIVAAVNQDFGHRSRHETLMADLAPSVETIKYLIRHLGRWMRAERRSVALHFMPARLRVLYQPLGVVGVIAPWNYPISLALVPVATAIAAGNRVMLKPSEFTPATSTLLASLLAQGFPPEEVATVVGDAATGAAFVQLPFDHLFFTGSTSVGRLVMRAAAENLVPVTLELGGKSPVIIDRGFSIDRAAASIAFGKLLNAGQTCVAPDYLLMPEDRVDAGVAALTREMSRLYPSLAQNRDYTSIINERHYQRLMALCEGARERGARVIVVDPRQEEPQLAAVRKVAPTLLVGVTDEMPVMQDEIFGPLLPIVPYRTLADAIAFVNARPRPLALYFFSDDARARHTVLTRTTSGNVCINETNVHYVQGDIPFGGVGASGMGRYHGREGFLTFSHAKGVFEQSRLNSLGLLKPPYGKVSERVLGFLLR
jgi:coniferyl-aldehyde dehydrogenase